MSAFLLYTLLLTLLCHNVLAFRLAKPRCTKQSLPLLRAATNFPSEIASYYATIKDEVMRVDKQISDIEKLLSTSTSSAFNIIMQNKLNGLRLVVQRKRFEIEKIHRGDIDLQELSFVADNLRMQVSVKAVEVEPDASIVTSAAPLANEAIASEVSVEDRPDTPVAAEAEVASPDVVIKEDREETEVPAATKVELSTESSAAVSKGDMPPPSKDSAPKKPSSSLTKGTYDYGFSSKSYASGRPSLASDSYEVPPSALALSLQTFFRELLSIFKIDKVVDFVVKPLNFENEEALSKLRQLSLSTDAVLARELERGVAEAPFIIKKPYEIITGIIDQLFVDRNPIARFYFLETVARVPYYSYISMIHTYETLGWWRRSTTMKRIHFAQEYNELHHLMIWEALGGDQEWLVRFCAQHSAVFSFYFLVVMWAVSPKWAYNFSELLEGHAVDTYAEFAEANKELLQTMAPPLVAKEYYESKDMYIFDEFNNQKRRRPVINTLYDVVCSIRDDEGEHITTLRKCQGYEDTEEDKMARGK